MAKTPRRLPPVRSAGLVGRLLPRRAGTAPTACSPWSSGARPRSIVALGDLQRTVLAEQLYLARRQNDSVREAIAAAIRAEEPEVLLLLGDQVADGASDREWEYFDALTRELREQSTAIHALLGNHDYSRFDRARCERNFYSRFPWLRPGEPELVRFGEIAYVGLDSNFAMLGPALTLAQTEAYRTLLARLDDDPSVRAIVVASHHPPFTNSRLGGTAPVLRLFATPFLEARKTRLYLSAHVHSYERFEVEGRTFIVTGGGGGPRRRVDTSERRQWRNDVFRGDPMRPFHYVRLDLESDAIVAHTMMLSTPPARTGLPRWRLRPEHAAPEFVVGDRFRVEL